MTQNENIIPTVVIVDDHQIFRQGLKSLLVTENIANVIGEAANGLDFLELLKKLTPDLVLMDIDMPLMNGINATLKALELYPDLKIIAFSMYGDEEYYYKMIDCGVKGYLLKTSGIGELENAIQQVANGESYFSNEMLRKIISSLSKHNSHDSEKLNELTEREIEVLQQICQGFTTEEIAQKLFISPKTVKNHRANLLEKTNCKNTPGLIVYAIKNKIVKL